MNILKQKDDYKPKSNSFATQKIIQGKFTSHNYVDRKPMNKF